MSHAITIKDLLIWVGIPALILGGIAWAISLFDFSK